MRRAWSPEAAKARRAVLRQLMMQFQAPQDKAANYAFEGNAAASVFDQYPALRDSRPTGQIGGNDPTGGNAVSKKAPQVMTAPMDAVSAFPHDAPALLARNNSNATTTSKPDTRSQDRQTGMGSSSMHGKVAQVLNLTPQTQALHGAMATFDRSTPVSPAPNQQPTNPNDPNNLYGTRATFGPDLSKLRPFGADMTGGWTTNWAPAHETIGKMAERYPALMDNALDSLLKEMRQQYIAAGMAPEEAERNLYPDLIDEQPHKEIA